MIPEEMDCLLIQRKRILQKYDKYIKNKVFSSKYYEKCKNSAIIKYK